MSIKRVMAAVPPYMREDARAHSSLLAALIVIIIIVRVLTPKAQWLEMMCKCFPRNMSPTGQMVALQFMFKNAILERPFPSHSDSDWLEIQLIVLYKKAQDHTVCHDGYFANLRNVKNSNVSSGFWLLTVSTPNLVYSLGGLRYTFLPQKRKIGLKTWPLPTKESSQWARLWRN